MNLGNFNLRNLRQRDIAIIVLVVTIIAAVAWYFYLFRPTQERIVELETQIEQLDVQIRRGEAAQANLPDLRATVRQLEIEREIFLAQLPLEEEVSALIDQLRTSAGETDVEWMSIAQNGVSEDVQGVRPLGFSLTTRGNYGETMAFLDRLETLQRFTKIRQVGLGLDTDATGDNPELNASFAVTVYVFTGEDPGGQ